MKTQHRASEFTLSRADVERIANATTSARDRTLVELLFYGGLRVAEACSLDVRDAELDRSRLRIVGKGEKLRVVTIPPALVWSLRSLIGRRVSGPVFVSRQRRGDGHAQPITTRTAERILAAAAERAGVASPHPQRATVNPHLLRHSSARHMLGRGVDPRIVQHFLGHESVRTTLDVYGTPSEDEVAGDVLRAWDS